MNPLDASGREIAALYAALRAEGDPAHRVGWATRLQQSACFEILAGLADLSARPYSLLDAGCGTGDGYAFLRARGWRGTYTGVDLVAGSIAEAQARYPEATWLSGDLLALALPVHDYVFASGLFDVRTPDSPARLRAVLARAFGLCRRGLAWNMFSALPGERPERFYVEPLGDLLAVCEALTPWFVLRHEYAPGHFTVYLYRREHFLTPALQAVIGRVYLDAAFRQALAQAPEQAARDYGVTLQQLELLEGLL
jgi:SAM-dependent methyltransferase